jgi:hypothetical protein
MISQGKQKILIQCCFSHYNSHILSPELEPPEVKSKHPSALIMTQPEFLKYHKNTAVTTKGMAYIYEQCV